MRETSKNPVFHVSVCISASFRGAEAEGQRDIHKYGEKEYNSQGAEVRQSAGDSEGDCVSVCAV